VQRPTTPFEALEAARQDAAYQAAHEQAVQVVNGIAAQYVETRSQLASINLFSGENFSIPETSKQFPESFTPLVAPLPAGDDITSRTASSSPKQDTKTSFNSSEYVKIPVRERLTARRDTFAHLPTLSETPAIPHSGYSAPEIKRTKGSPVDSNSIVTGDILMPSTFEAATLPIEVPSSKYPTSLPALSDSRQWTLDDTDHRSSKEETTTQPRVSEGTQPTPSFEVSRTSKTTDHSTSSSTAKQKQSAKEASHFASEEGFDPQPVEIARNGSRLQSDLTESLPAGALSDNNAAIIPPYGGVGSIRSDRERRNPRPAYLKERKSTWLTDTLAVPPNGVIAPDWFEQH